MKRHRGLLLALLVSAAGLGIQWRANRETLRRYDRHTLPAFDAYVYMAMADHPPVFTVLPWGRRILTPWIVHVLPIQSTADAFFVLTLGSLWAAGGLLFLFLRRLGHGEWASLAAVAAFGLSEPVGATLAYTFLADPLSIVLELALLLALEAGAGAAALALVMVLGALTKEVALLFLPLAYLALREREGDRPAAAKAAIAALPALLATLALRSWQPQIRSTMDLPGGDVFWLAVYRILAGWPDWWSSALLGGLLPLACLGALRRQARPFLRRHGYLLLVTLALPFAASVYTDDTDTVPFFAQDIPRLLLYALPVLFPLGLTALDRLWPHLQRPPEPARVPRAAGLLAAAATAALLAFPLLACDRYRRVDLRGPRDGRLVLALCRESLAFAQRLERGKAVAYSPEARRFAPGRSYPYLLEKMRWFLRDGWGRQPHYGWGLVVMEGREASILLPCFRPADWDVALTLSAPQAERLRVAVNDRPAGEAVVGPEPSKATLRVPASSLIRGDNLLRLVAVGDTGRGVRLHELVVRPAPAP